MKKVFTILFIFVVLLSGMTVRYSAHYCQGTFIASRLSLTGADASCGMSNGKGENKETQFSTLMCVNEITSYTFIDNYVYSPQMTDLGKDLQNIELPFVITPKISLIPASPDFKNLPPGSGGLLKSESEVLCVFRI